MTTKLRRDYFSNHFSSRNVTDLVVTDLVISTVVRHAKYLVFTLMVVVLTGQFFIVHNRIKAQSESINAWQRVDSPPGLASHPVSYEWTEQEGEAPDGAECSEEPFFETRGPSLYYISASDR